MTKSHDYKKKRGILRDYRRLVSEYECYVKILTYKLRIIFLKG